MNKEFEYDKKMDEVCSRYTHDIIEEIEEHYPKDFFTDHNIKYDVESVLAQMYEEIKTK